MSNSIVVTGAGGFVGGQVAERLARDGFLVRGALYRRGTTAQIPGVEWCHPGSIHEGAGWPGILSGADVVVHAAAKVHAPGTSDADDDYFRINTDGTLRLAEQALEAGVRRFVFLSTVKVHGEGRSDTAITELSPLDPQTHYAASKARAESGLIALAGRGAMDVVIVRPPIVYGPNGPGNFRRLVQLVKAGLPLPLGAVRNRRSLVSIDNLADLVATCVVAEQAANQCFIVADAEVLSTAELVGLIATALNRRAWIFSMPTGWLRWAARVVGAGREFEKLCGSFYVDTGKAREILSWRPPISAAEGVFRAVAPVHDQGRPSGAPRPNRVRGG